MSKKRWNEKFSQIEFLYGEEANAFIQEKSVRIPPQSKVACFAEGEGRNAVYLAKLGHQVTAYDQSEVGLKKAGELANKHDVNIQTEVADLTSDQVSAQTYDASVLVFGHVPKEDQTFLLNNLIGSVKPGGRVIVEVYSEKQLSYNTGGPGKVELLYDPVHILSIIDPYKCEHFYYGEVERNEGPKHNGTSHVIQFVLRV